ncbi:hypothetical protein [Limnoglobus roseus]|nr:hypothetical protein [Limnoglobus roseus]
MRPVAAAVAEDVGVLAPRVLQRVGEDRQPVERPVGVDAFREADGGRGKS